MFVLFLSCENHKKTTTLKSAFHGVRKNSPIFRFFDLDLVYLRLKSRVFFQHIWEYLILHCITADPMDVLEAN